MIAVSGLLVIIAFVTLILGVFQSDSLTMIFISIAASILAAISLATGVVKSRPKAVAVGGPDSLGGWGGTATPVLDRPPFEETAEEAEEPEVPATTSVLTLDEPAAGEEEVVPPVLAPAQRRRAPAKSAARKTAGATRKTAGGARKTTAKTTRAAPTVLVIPDRDKFHKETCRYVKGQTTQALAKADARKQGYKPCGVCKP